MGEGLKAAVGVSMARSSLVLLLAALTVVAERCQCLRMKT